MPHGNGTGPNGMGPMTGRAAGYCAGYGVSGFANPAVGGGFGRGFGRGGGRGRGRGFGRGFGWGRNAYAAVPAAPVNPATYGPTPDRERQVLQQQASQMEQMLEDIRRRLADLENDQDE